MSSDDLSRRAAGDTAAIRGRGNFCQPLLWKNPAEAQI
jgi:hypothetical protein